MVHRSTLAALMYCVQTNSTTAALELVSPTPADLSTCQLVIGTYSELSPSLFRIDEQGGADIAVAVLLLFAVAFVFRMLAKAILHTDETQT